jgi:hypothetical protein
MRIYIFKSETTQDLRAFAGDPAGGKLPPRHGPWTGTASSGRGRRLPITFRAA